MNKMVSNGKHLFIQKNYLLMPEGEFKKEFARQIFGKYSMETH